MRPSGIAASSAFIFAGSSIVDVLIGVATAPGPTPTTRMPCGPSSTPAVRVSIRIPPLDRQYGVLPGIGQSSCTEVMLTMRAAAALGDHLLRRELGAEERALQVDRQHLLVLRLGRVEHRRARLDAGVVDHDVEAAERLDRRVDEPSAGPRPC